MLRYKGSHSLSATKQLHSVPERARGRLAGHSSPPPSPQLTLISCLSFALRQVALTPACLLARSLAQSCCSRSHQPHSRLVSPRPVPWTLGLLQPNSPASLETLPRARAIHEIHLHSVCALSLVFAFFALLDRGICSSPGTAKDKQLNPRQDKSRPDKPKASRFVAFKVFFLAALAPANLN